MPRPALSRLLLAAVLAWAMALPALAQQEAARVTGAPGAVLAMQAQAPASPDGSPVVLEARLARPGAESPGSDIRWLVAAAPDKPVSVTWEFAYPWEVTPGVWTMRVLSEGREIARASFDVALAEETAPQAPAKPVVKPEPESSTKKSAAPAKPEAKQPAKPDPSRDDPRPRQTVPGPKAIEPPARRAQPGAVGGDPNRTLFVLVGGSYSEEARALWVSVFLEKRGVKACVREETVGGRRLWAVITGWSSSQADIALLRAQQAATVGETITRTMRAGELSKGLRCP